ncbi:hypothetical protein E4U44_004529 [Claviceps purpurea]|nr:hypothetical protein E4U44_004529 [Claviceps purpurea]
MKFSAILGSLAIYGIQVHAIPTDSDFQAIQPIEASKLPNSKYSRRNNISKSFPMGPGAVRWYVLGNTDGCVVLVDRNAGSCSGWTLLPPLTIGIGSASDCSSH